jgi:hypothetical protein
VVSQSIMKPIASVGAITVACVLVSLCRLLSRRLGIAGRLVRPGHVAVNAIDGIAVQANDFEERLLVDR